MPTSAPDLIGYSLLKYSDGQIRLIVKFSGKLDKDLLAKAVRLAFDAQPVLGCRFVEKPFRPYWQRCSNLEAAFEFHSVTNSDQEQATCSFLLAPLDPISGPQVKVGLFRSGVDTLCIKVTHIVADGAASMEYLQLISGLYRRLKRQPGFQPNHNLEASRSTFQIIRYVSLPKLVSSCSHISIPKPTWQFLSSSEDQTSARLLIRRIGPEHFAHIRTYAKNHNVTIGDVLLTAYYRALFEVLDPPENIPHALFIPVNLRKHIPAGTGESICMLATSFFVKVPRRKNESFEETLSRVQAVMNKEKAKQSELGLMFAMELLLVPGYLVARIVGSSMSSVSELPEFSNIGVIDAKIADFGEVGVQEILSAGPTMAPPLFCLGTHTFNGELRFTASICGSDSYRLRVERFLEVLVKELPVP